MNWFATAALAAGALVAGLATPARASTIPDMTLRRGQLAVTAGFADGSVDWAVQDRLQVGAGGFFTLLGAGAYGRVTYRLAEGTPFGDVGLHLAGGSFNGVLAKMAPGQFVFLGPVIAQPIGESVVLRASLGLLAGNSHQVVLQPGAIYASDTNVVSRAWGLGHADISQAFVPNLELAFRLGAQHEITLGGNALLGWRGRF